MEKKEHLRLPEYCPVKDKIVRQGGGGFKPQTGRDKNSFYNKNLTSAENLSTKHQELKKNYKDKIDPNLIFHLKVNQRNARFETFNTLGFEVLNVTDNK